MKAALIWDPSFTQYKFRADHPFNPRRLELSVSLIEELGLLDGDRFRMVAPRMATDAELLRVHSLEYLEVVKRLSLPGADRSDALRWGLATEDNPVFPGMHDIAATVVGGTLQAAEMVMSGEVRRAFAIAGGLHHAHRDRASGFCVYSDVGAAIAWLREALNARVLYVDYDAHHGDGVQGLFYSDPAVLTVSMHESGHYLFPGTGFVDELGEGSGLGYSWNVPMEPQSEDETWLEIYGQLIEDAARAFRPDVIVLQSGCDAHAMDPLTHLRCTTRVYEETVRLTCRIADEYCQGRIVATGGGGYAVWTVVPRAWTLVWATLTEQSVANALPRSWTEKWQGESPCILPDSLRDPPDSFAPASRGPEIRAINRRAWETLRRTALPLMTEGIVYNEPAVLTAETPVALEPRTYFDRLGEPFVIRPMRADDAAELRHFYEEFEPKRRAHGLPPEKPERIDEWLGTILPQGVHLVVVRDRLIGHSFVTPTDQEGVYEYAVFLHQDYRGQGIGTRLNLSMTEAARAAGVKKLWLTVEPRNKAALRSYIKVGFDYVPQTRFSIEPEMELSLQDPD